MEYLLSEKGKNLYLMDEFKYRHQRTLNNSIQRWSCTNKNCNSYLKLSEAHEIIESTPNSHNHPPDSAISINRQKINNFLTRKAIEDISARPAKLIRQELKDSDTESFTIKDTTLLRKNICRARLSKFPKLPKTFSEFHSALKQFEISTNRGEKFLSVNGSETNIVMFSTESNLRILAKQKNIFMDGTFYSCPKPFTQLFTIHGVQNNIYIPLAFFLLPDKSESTYSGCFSFLIDRVDSFEMCLCPANVFVDFEQAI